MLKYMLAFVLVAQVAQAAQAEDFTRRLTGIERGKSYELRVNEDGSLTLSPLLDLAPNGQDPRPNPTNPFVEQIKLNTQAVLQAGGTKTTGAALSAVYSLVADAVAEPNGIDHAIAWTAVKRGTDEIMSKSSDKAAWDTWRAAMAGAVNKLRDEGHLNTKEETVKTLRQIAQGLDAATGNTFNPRTLVTSGAAAADTDGTADGIFDGFDLGKLIELIKQIMELIKLFKGIGL